MFTPERQKPLFSGSTPDVEGTPLSSPTPSTPENIPKRPDYEALLTNVYDQALAWFINDLGGNKIAEFTNVVYMRWVVEQESPDRTYALPITINNAVCIESKTKKDYVALVVGKRKVGPYQHIQVPSLQFGFASASTMDVMKRLDALCNRDEGITLDNLRSMVNAVGSKTTEGEFSEGLNYRLDISCGADERYHGGRSMGRSQEEWPYDRLASEEGTNALLDIIQRTAYKYYINPKSLF